MVDYIESNVTGKKYRLSDVVRIVNVKQIALYLKFGLELLDIYPSVDREDRPIVVCIFDRKESKTAYDLWCKHELD